MLVNHFYNCWELNLLGCIFIKWNRVGSAGKINKTYISILQDATGTRDVKNGLMIHAYLFEHIHHDLERNFLQLHHGFNSY